MRRFIAISCLLLFISTQGSGQTEHMDFGMGCLPETDVASIPKQPQLMERDMKNLPSSYSLLQYCPTPQSQGQYGTCTSWATAYAFRTILEAINHGWTSKEQITKEAYSPLFIYAQIKDRNDANCSKGSCISHAMKLMRDVGNVKKSMFDVMCADVVSNNLKANAASHKIGSYSALVTYGQYVIEPVKISLVKKALAENQPVVVGMQVYSSFQNCKDYWNGEMAGFPLGGHAMCVVGYDDNKYGGAFLFQNSWGERWGNGGYTWVRYSDFCKTVSQAYTGALPYTPSPVIKKNILKGELGLQLSTGSSMQAVLITNETLPYYNIRGSFISGTRYRMYLTNNEPAFVYIIGSDLKGNTSQVFPPRDDISAALTYKQSHIAIPDEKWYIEMDDNVGTDYMCVLYAKHELDIKSIVNTIKNGNGTIYERLKRALGATIAPNSDVTFNNNRIAFDAATNGTVVPIIVAINHK